MGIFRFAFFVFLVALMISLATSLFGGAAAAGAAIGGAMLFLPILFFKVVLFVMLFGFFGRMAGHRLEPASRVGTAARLVADAGFRLEPVR